MAVPTAVHGSDSITTFSARVPRRYRKLSHHMACVHSVAHISMFDRSFLRRPTSSQRSTLDPGDSSQDARFLESLFQ
jgi:hypothetical protein